jgi:transcriptional regulator with XRE-family HTH domain
MKGTGKEPDRELLRQVFGMTVLELRRALGMAQETLGLESGIDRGYMGALERGRYMPTIAMVYRLLPALRVNFVQFAEHFETNLRRARRAPRS